MRSTTSRALAAPAILLALAAATAPGSASAATWCVPAAGATTCDGDHIAATVGAAITGADRTTGPGADAGDNGVVEGADVYDGVVERVRIDDEGARFGRADGDGRGVAMTLRNGALHDVEVELTGADVEGISLAGWYVGTPYELERVDVRADRALQIQANPRDDAPDPVVHARRVRLSGVKPLVVSSGRVELSDAVIASVAPPRRWDDDSVAAVEVNNGFDGLGAELLLDRVTVVGEGGAATGQAPHHAFAVTGNGLTAEPTRLRARHVIAAGFDRTLLHGDWGGAIEAIVTDSLLDVREGPGSVARGDDGTNASPATIALTAGNRVGDPRFADRAAGPPFAERFGGDLRLLAGSPAVDVGGEELIAGEATDLGGAPRPVDGDGDGAVAADAGAFEHQWVPIGPGPLPRTGPEPEPGPGPGPVGPEPHPAADRVAPVVRGLRWMPARRPARRAGRGGAAGRRAAPAGSFRFALSERARVIVTIERRAGRRWQRTGALRAGWRTKGPATIRFRGRIGRRTLARGGYRARLVAVDGAGNRSAPRTVRFTLSG